MRRFFSPAPAALVAAGLALAPPAAADPKWDAEAAKVNKHFQTLDTHIKKADWRHPRTEGTAKQYMTRLLKAIDVAAKKFPGQKGVTDRMRVGAQKMAQRVMAKLAEAKKAAAAPKKVKAAPTAVGSELSDEAAAALVAPYKVVYDAAKNFPGSINPGTVSRSLATLEAFDLPAIEAKIAADKARFPELFQYYGMEDTRGRYADLPYGGRQKPKVTSKPLKQLLTYYVPRIYEAKAKLAGKGEALAGGVREAIGKAETLDDAIRAQRLARACVKLAPGDAAVAAAAGEAAAHVKSKTEAIAGLITGPTHAANFKKILGFSAPTKPGEEVDANRRDELVLGEPLYLVGYLSQSVKSIGRTKHQSELGYAVATYPDLNFRLAGQRPALILPTRTKDLLKSKDAMAKIGVIEVPLLPDPDAPALASHLDYLPGLHFARWLKTLPEGRHIIKFGLSALPTATPDSPGAFGEFAVSVTPESKAALEGYYRRLWAKKLSTVVFPDTFGIEDRKGHIPNASELAKYGELLRLSAAQTGKVMKPFPLQHQIKNFVGHGFGAFRKDGKISVIGLAFVRRPEEPTLRWSGLSGLPDHSTISMGKVQIGPRLHNLGYEILEENVSKTGEW